MEWSEPYLLQAGTRLRSQAWADLLLLAFRHDGHNPRGLYGALDGLYHMGADLRYSANGNWVLFAGTMDPDEYRQQRDRYLLPYKDTLKTWLGALGQPKE